MKLLIVGPQGSGKSTQSKLLAETLRVPFIETGQIFRDMGGKVRTFLQAGEMVPDDITSEIVRKRLEDGVYKNGFIMNGYPRNLNQVELFDPGFDKVFYLKVSDEEVIDRLLKRAREDDTRELIEKRLSDYHKLTEPILEHYKGIGILEEIEGSGKVEEIQQILKDKVNG